MLPASLLVWAFRHPPVNRGPEPLSPILAVPGTSMAVLRLSHNQQ